MPDETLHVPGQTEIVKPGEEEVDQLDLIAELRSSNAVTPTSFDLDDPSLTWDRWVAIGRFFGRIKRSTSWWIGDWINFGEAVYGERYAQAVDVTELSKETLINYAYVARSVPRSRRREELSFGTHAEVAPLEPSEQKKWLDAAAENGWTRAELRERLGASLASGDDEGMGGGEMLSRGEVLEDAARSVWLASRKNGNGSYEVPPEPMARLASALGEGE